MITKEAIEALRKSLSGVAYISVAEATDALTAAFAAMPGPAVKVKPLEWVEHWGGSNDDLPYWRGKNELGLHVSVDFIGKYNLDRHSDAPQDELEAAKAAAQADYEARILSALTPAPDLASENERLRAALEMISAETKESNEPIGRSVFKALKTCGEIADLALERT